MSFQLILVVHILLALGLIALILIQHGKGADAGTAFGAGTSGSVFGARGANSFLYKLTTSLAFGFFLTSLTLAYLATNDSSVNNELTSVMERVTTIEGAVPSDVPMVVTPILTESDISDISN
ncbi:protein translocase subunit secG [Candidatus Ruthia magnifica str. Cm (Calyptogena magnifica)]|uniref:Protein-export membrane protein SecG n=1 Tax=Ruthia magnifica subsp. Calyptogena magnifica TaxID=413404 RepID=A1AXX2_RUTMC|nr:preprotein translocase subunit SecG [Candidatus Ruthturnera calyptogenae]ABL02779.1 protein translocase subunit secG [Candidatus Ruthia magnifica str. Cm (Calyptogena magnifica)]